MIAVSNHAVSVSIVVLVLFVAFLAIMGGLLVKLVVNTRKDGAGGGSGCLLATGFGVLTLLLAGFAFTASVVTIAVAAGPDVIDETLTRLDAIEQREARREPQRAAERAEVRRELGDALDEAGRAYDDAMETARAAGADAREDIRAAMQEAAKAMREARETVREALRDVRTATHDGTDAERGAAEHAAPARMELRLDVEGDPGPALAELVERVIGTEAECVVLRDERSTTARWVFAVPQPPAEDVGPLEDRLRAALAQLELPEGVRVEFRDVVLQDAQHHAQR